MDCFLCDRIFSPAEQLFIHLKEDHGTPTDFTYICTACTPKARFQDLPRFKRHVVNKHKLSFNAVLEEIKTENSQGPFL